VEYNEGKIKLRVPTTNMNELISQILSKLKIQIPPHNLRFEYYDEAEKDFFLLDSLDNTSELPEKPTLRVTVLKKETLQSLSVTHLQDIVIQNKIASGNFGAVFQGLYLRTTPVALKSLTQDEESVFLAEIKMLSKLHHPNVVQYLGVYQQEGKDYIVMEFMPQGNVKGLLENNKATITTLDILKMARDAAAGMNYLSQNKIVHGDLAARNLLAKKEDSLYTVKIADFGLSKTLYDGNTYTSSRKAFALQWAAPEVIKNHTISVASDVFSFGTLLWEMLQYADIPFFDCDRSTTINRIVKGEMLDKPLNCPDEIYKLMKMCWAMNTQDRPSFGDVYSSIDNCVAIEHFLPKEDILKVIAPDYYTTSQQ